MHDKRSTSNAWGFYDIIPSEALFRSVPALPGVGMTMHQIQVETEREEDGRWIAEVPELPGVMVYGDTRMEAVRKAKALALRIIADRIEHGETIADWDETIFGLPA